MDFRERKESQRESFCGINNLTRALASATQSQGLRCDWCWPTARRTQLSTGHKRERTRFDCGRCHRKSKVEPVPDRKELQNNC